MKTENERQVNKKTSTGKAREKAKSSLAAVICSPAGSDIQPVYKRVYNKELDRSIVVKVDTVNIKEFIQASKAKTDFALLQKRFVELGEIPADDPTLGSNDLTNMPSDIHGVYALVNDVAGNFAILPESIQKIFGSKEAYLESILKGTYQGTILRALQAANAPKQQESEVKHDE